MKYNYGLEKAKFDKEWKTFEEEYISAGMTPQQIISLKAFDKSVFNSNRAYYRRSIRLDSINELSAEEDYLLSPLDDWTEEIDNDSFYPIGLTGNITEVSEDGYLLIHTK